MAGTTLTTKQQPEGVNHQVALATFYLLAGIVAAWTALGRTAVRLRIQHRRPSAPARAPLGCTRMEIVVVQGSPSLDEANTSYVERNNLSMRMGMRRFTRLTNGFSKRIGKHVAMVHLYAVHYNYCRIHKTLRVTPAMEAKIETTMRDAEWIVGLIDARAPKPNRPKTYRKQEKTTEGD